MRRLATTVVSASLVFGLGVTAWGLSNIAISIEYPIWHWRFLLYCLLLLVLVTRLVPVSFTGASGLLAILLALLTGTLWSMLVVAWFFIAATLLGRSFLSALWIENKAINLVVCFLVGACLYGTAVGLLAHLPINYPGLYAIMLAAPVMFNWRAACAFATDLVRWLSASRAYINWQELLLAALALLYLAVALMPEVGHDALAMHQFVAAHMALRHEWSFDVSTYVWAVMPMLGDWIFSVVYMQAGETAARLLNVVFIFVLTRLAYELVIWAGGTVKGARWTALIVLTTPLTFTEGSSLFIESIWASYIVAGLLVMVRAISSDDHLAHKWGAAGMLLGAALAAKAVTLTILPILVLLLLWTYKRWVGSRSLPALGIGIFLLLMIGAIPYATAWLLTGNPVFPFFNQLFQSRFFPLINFDTSSIFGSGLTWDFLYQATFNSGKYLEAKAGASGFQWFLLFLPASIALFFIRNSRGIALLIISVLAVVLTFMSVAYLRYIFPSFIVASACIGIAWSNFLTGNSLMRSLAYLAGFLAIVINMLFFTSGTHYGNINLSSLVSPDRRYAYLQEYLPIRNAVEVVNRLNNEQMPVAVLAPPLTAGLNADALYSNWYNAGFRTSIKDAASAKDIADVLIESGVEYVILDSNWDASDKREFIEQATVNLANFNSIGIRRLRDEYRFNNELLINSDFGTDKGWMLEADRINRMADGVLVSVKSPMYQIVKITPARRYLNEVVAQCADEPAQGRIQVNWLDARQQYISTNIQVFDCSPSAAMHSMQVVSPPNSEFAAVYITGHTPISLVFSEVSFRQ